MIMRWCNVQLVVVVVILFPEEYNIIHFIHTTVQQFHKCIPLAVANTIFKSKRIWLFALIINCTIIMKTNSRFPRNVYAISNRIWCNKHLRHTTMEKYDKNGKDGYFRFDDDNNLSYRHTCIFSIADTEMGQLNTNNPIYCNENER